MVNLQHIKEMILCYDLYVNYSMSFRDIGEKLNLSHMTVKRRLEQLKDYDLDKYERYKGVDNGIQ